LRGIYLISVPEKIATVRKIASPVKEMASSSAGGKNFAIADFRELFP
jgi:hypothetical protein